MPFSAKRRRSRHRIRDTGRLDWQDAHSGCHTWRIDNFSTLTHYYYHYSEVFTIGGCKWRILIFPKENYSDNFKIRLAVPDAATLPAGWSRKASLTLSMVDEKGDGFSTKRGIVHVFRAQEPDWGAGELFEPCSDLDILRNGFPLNGTVIVKVEIDVLSVAPPIIFPPIVVPDREPPSMERPLLIGYQVTEANGHLDTAPPVSDASQVMEMNRNTTSPAPDAHSVMDMNLFDSFFTRLEEFIDNAETKEGSVPNNDGNNQEEDLISGSPSLAEVEEAKQSLKECLSEIFELDMKDRLATALLTLTRAEFGLSSDQQESVKAFWENFNVFISGFLMFEQANFEFELQKLGRDQMFSAMKKKHETHLLNRQLLEALTREEKELEKRMDEVKSRKEKIVSDWEGLVAKSEELKSTYTAQEKKLAESEEKKRIAEERMSRSTAAWSSLKAQFHETPFETEEGNRYLTIPPSLSQKAPVDVSSSLEYMLNCQCVHFRSLKKPREDDFVLELSKLHNYDEVVERVARRVGVDHLSKIRLTSHNCFSQEPNPWPIRFRGLQNLAEMLVHANQTSEILYYEVLDIPLPELEGLKNMKIAFRPATDGQVVIHNIRLPKQSTMQDVLIELKKKVLLSHPDAELRLLQTYYYKIYKILPLNDKVENINDQYWTLLAEEIPEEEKNLGPHDHVISAYHFLKETAQNRRQAVIHNFGEPFFLVIHEGEILAEVKARLQKKLQVPDECFSKWRFVFNSLGCREYLDDSEILWTHFKRKEAYQAWEQCLGLEHSDSQEVLLGGEKEQDNSSFKQANSTSRRIFRKTAPTRIRAWQDHTTVKDR